MTDIDILYELIKDTARVSLEDHYGKKRVTLTEAQQTHSSITIFNVPDDSIVIKADAFVEPKAVFKNSRGECKRADYVMITDTGEEKFIVYIEMKSGKGDNPQIIQQLKGAACFVAYCREIGLSFWNEREFLSGYTSRYVSVVKTSINKRPTRETLRPGLHDSPENMLKIQSTLSISFKHLI